MDRLLAMQVFTKVVEMNGFSRAADALNLPRASATTIIRNLEEHLQLRLLNRTTRRLKLTSEGAQYYELCVRVLSEIDGFEEALTKISKGPKGRLRVDMPGSIGRLIVAPRIMEFRERYPDIELMIGFGDKPIDLVQEGVDCAIRVGHLQNSSLVRRSLGYLHLVTAASPSYVARYGQPASVEGLQNHFAVQFFSSITGRIVETTFTLNSQAVEIEIPTAMLVSDVEAYVICAVQGVGIIQAPGYALVNDLRAGRLVEILPHLKPKPLPIAAVYPNSRYLANKVRVFVDWIESLFEGHTSISRLLRNTHAGGDVATYAPATNPQ